MGKKTPGDRDGTGPYAGSYQNKTAKEGKRQQAGEPCPSKKRKNVVSVSGAKKTIKARNQRRRNVIQELFND